MEMHHTKIGRRVAAWSDGTEQAYGPCRQEGEIHKEIQESESVTWNGLKRSWIGLRTSTHTRLVVRTNPVHNHLADWGVLHVEFARRFLLDTVPGELTPVLF
jgi:hypothetical protein